MGTNYYAEFPACVHCGRGPKNVHICKSLTSFEAHQETEEHPALTSWRDYRSWLEAGGVVVRDEYGELFDVAEFIARVEATAHEDRRRSYDWVAEHETALVDHTYWLDADEFTFSWGEFS